jgi:hypothetical protein
MTFVTSITRSVPEAGLGATALRRDDIRSSGNELARAIHYLEPRHVGRSPPFNCDLILESLIERELCS